MVFSVTIGVFLFFSCEKGGKKELNLENSISLQELYVIQKKFIEIKNSYNENKHLINDDKLDEIIGYINLFFNENNAPINYCNENYEQIKYFDELNYNSAIPNFNNENIKFTFTKKM